MRELHEMPVFQKSYDLYKKLHELVKKFPKGDKYSLGETLKQETIELLTAIVEAGQAKREWKAPRIDEALTKAELLKVFTRLALETKCIPEKAYIEMQEILQEIGRMLGGWKRSL